MAVTIDKPKATTKEGKDDAVVLDYFSVGMMLGDSPSTFSGNVQVDDDDGVDLTTKLTVVQQIALKKAQAMFNGVVITDAPDTNTPN